MISSDTLTTCDISRHSLSFFNKFLALSDKFAGRFIICAASEDTAVMVSTVNKSAYLETLTRINASSSDVNSPIGESITAASGISCLALSKIDSNDNMTCISNALK